MSDNSTVFPGRFSGRTVIITGGAGGIGLATAERLAAEGARLTLVDVDAAALDRARGALLRGGAEEEDVITVVADVTDEEQVRGYVTATTDRWGRVDGFFNNAGIDGSLHPLAEYGSELFAKLIAVNLTGVFLGLKHMVPVMEKQGAGAVVNTASIGGIRGWAHHYGYNASKHGVVGLTRAVAAEAGAKGVTVNAVAPGGVRTDMAVAAMKKVNPENPAAAEAEFCKGVPMGRMAAPAEIAGTVAFLLSADAGFINGHVLTVDGGQTAKSG